MIGLLSLRLERVKSMFLLAFRCLHLEAQVQRRRNTTGTGMTCFQDLRGATGLPY